MLKLSAVSAEAVACVVKLPPLSVTVGELVHPEPPFVSVTEATEVLAFAVAA
jgi:hypothetical protein